MRILYLFIPAFITLMFFGCDKKANDTKQAGFNVNGVADLKIKANKSGTLSLNIQQVSGDQETVSLSLTGTPANVQHEFSTSSGTPTFASVLTLSANYATTGSYPLTLTATGASGGSKPYNFNLIIEEAEDCATKMTGSYGGSSTCGSGASTYAVVKDPAQMNGIIFKQGSNIQRCPGCARLRK